MRSKALSFLLFSIFLQAAYSQTLADFESFNLPLDTFDNGSGGTNVFSENGLNLSCTWDSAYGGYWAAGFALSTMRDDSTEGSSNLYSAVAASGDNSPTYAMVNCFSSASVNAEFPLLVDGIQWQSIAVCNSTYAYLSMLNGDAIAKKFGGSSGDDPDYFLLRIFSVRNQQRIDSVDHYLADFRFSDNSQDYIQDGWSTVDLSLLAYGHELEFTLKSSDMGAFGMNTPAFFAIDNIGYDYVLGYQDLGTPDHLFQTTTLGFVSHKDALAISAYDMSGRLVKSFSVDKGYTNLGEMGFPSGVYALHGESEGEIQIKKIFIP